MWISSALIILGYALIMLLLRVTSIKESLKGLLPRAGLYLIQGLSIALIEETIFRTIFLNLILWQWLKFDFATGAMINALIFSACHFWLGIHKKANHQIMLFIGLFLFSMTFLLFSPALIAPAEFPFRVSLFIFPSVL